MGLRIALLGLTSGVGATQTFFPAMILVTLYAGWRWGPGADRGGPGLRLVAVGASGAKP
jgi:hypothetical protein